MRNVKFKISLFLLAISVTSAGLTIAQQTSQQNPTATPPADANAAANNAAVNQMIDKIVDRETALSTKLKNMHPMVETYLQNLDKDEVLAFRPTGDRYFLGKMDFKAENKQKTMLGGDGVRKNLLGRITQLYSVKFLPGGFIQMLVIGGTFDRKTHDWEFVRREFLGEVRTLVFDVQPKKGNQGFKGRIWAEDQDYNIVRFNGSNGSTSSTRMYFHFDSWREYVGNGEWLPAYVYTEESNMGYLMGSRRLRFKGQTRLWGYNVGKSSAQNELTALIVDSNQVKDNVDEAEGISPVKAQRAWERDAEDNIIERLEKAGLIAPDSEVNKVLETVTTNLEVTNNLNIDPPTRARVLLTSPLESFTIGNTIVLSRGLIDVLPDEASLATIIAHELAHIALSHRIDTKYSFNDRMLFEDPEAFQKIQLKRDPKEEIDADKKAAELLKNSPYKDKLGNAGLFLKALDERAAVLPRLLQSHIGNAMLKGDVRRMAELKTNAPELDMSKVDQIAALPLGGRVHVDPWSAKIDLMKAKPVALIAPREKMPFEVTPIQLYLTRQLPGQQQGATAATATTAPAPTAKQPAPAQP